MSFTVALIGCDGAGKTTVARALERDASLPIRYLYMGVSADSADRQLPTTRLIHALKRKRGAPPDTRGPRDRDEALAPPPPAGLAKRVRRNARSLLRLSNRVAEEWYRQILAYASMARGAIVVFDRHFYADYHAYDLSGAERTLSRRLHGWLLKHAYPKPDLVIYLDAPAEVLFARKGERTSASLTRRREDYLSLKAVAPHFHVVSATQPLDDVIDEVGGLIRDFRSTR